MRTFIFACIHNAGRSQMSAALFNKYADTSKARAIADTLITMGCGDECPYVPGLRRDDWPLPDPKGQGIETVRKTREEIGKRVLELLAREGLRSSETN